jgi:hypothetical protein
MSTLTKPENEIKNRSYFNFEIDPDIHHKVKVMALEKKMKIKDLMSLFIERELLIEEGKLKVVK